MCRENQLCVEVLGPYGWSENVQRKAIFTGGHQPYAALDNFTGIENEIINHGLQVNLREI